MTGAGKLRKRVARRNPLTSSSCFWRRSSSLAFFALSTCENWKGVLGKGTGILGSALDVVPNVQHATGRVYPRVFYPGCTFTLPCTKRTLGRLWARIWSCLRRGAQAVASFANVSFYMLSQSQHLRCGCTVQQFDKGWKRTTRCQIEVQSTCFLGKTAPAPLLGETISPLFPSYRKRNGPYRPPAST